MDKRAPGGLNQKKGGDRATDQCQSLESKKTFKLQIKKGKTMSQQEQKKKKL